MKENNLSPVPNSTKPTAIDSSPASGPKIPVPPEDGRRPAEGGSGKRGRPARVPDSEVSATPKRRVFTGAHKLRVLEEADRCKQGELGQLLRREGIYHATLQQWRKQRQEETLSGLERKRGPKEKFIDPVVAQKLLVENARLRKRLEQAELIIEVQKKISSILNREDPE